MAKKTIAIIGATGKTGSAVSKRLAKENYRLLLFDDDRKTLNSLAQEIRAINPLADIDCMGCAADASWEADIIIPAVPSCSQKDIAQKIKPYANRKIVISIPDSLNETKNKLGSSTDTDNAEELQTLLPGAKVVNAITFFRSDFSQLSIEGNQEDAFFAGDDKEALEAIAEILKTVALIPNN
jgi:8-hydroxy-5-deazaflavin:NADPH oxidoreductase